MLQKIKINGEWKHIVAVYKKVNGHWVAQTNYDFDNQAYFYDSGEVDTDVFMIVANDSYTGKEFYVIATMNNTQVSPSWSITSGNQYATIDSNGKVTILTGVQNSFITVQADYSTFTDAKQIAITYDSFLRIEGPSSMTGTSGNIIALYHSQVVNPVWTITSGASFATINSAGEITILSSGQITIQAEYDGSIETKTITLVYDTSSSSQTAVDPDTGSITTTETTTTTDPDTGTVTETSTSTTTNEDGSSSETQTETITNTDGSSTTSSTTTNSDGTSSETNSSVSAPDPNTGAITSQTETVNYDENGDPTGSQTNETTQNTDGSSQSSTTNYDASGDPIDTTNVGTDSTGNINTQNIEYDEQGNQTVTGYDIDTTASEGEGKEITGDGVNTEFVPFDDNNNGFICHIRFKSIRSEQPRPPLVEDTDDAGQNYLYNIMSAKSTVAVNSKYPGFEIRWTLKKTDGTAASGTGSGLQFRYAPAGANNTVINMTPDANNEFDVTVTYDPNKLYNEHQFTVSSGLGNFTTTTNDVIFATNNIDFTLGYAISSQGQPYRHAAVTIYEFTITKLQ